jgi:hypothetical protein
VTYLTYFPTSPEWGRGLLQRCATSILGFMLHLWPCFAYFQVVNDSATKFVSVVHFFFCLEGSNLRPVYYGLVSCAKCGQSSSTCGALSGAPSDIHSISAKVRRWRWFQARICKVSDAGMADRREMCNSIIIFIENGELCFP